MDAIGSTDKTHKVYDGLFHEVFNEPEQDAVLDDVVAWLKEHI
jgi:alpha-beta hydrolase superfamily lysophospholipase